MQQECREANMVDLNHASPTPPTGGQSKLKNLMERTPGIGVLKSKFLTVLGNSNELLNGISNKFTLNISSSDSEYYDEEDEQLPKFDETIDYTKIDFESRRVKARRAYEEIISGRYRHPNLVSKVCLAEVHTAAAGKSKPTSASSSSSTSSSSSCSLSTHANNRSQVSSTTCSNSFGSRHSGGYGRPGRVVAGARRSDLDIQRDLTNSKDNDSLTVGAVKENTEKCHHESNLITPASAAAAATSADSTWALPRRKNSNSSTLTSLHDEPKAQISPSVESTDWRNFVRSESQNSVPSWASSISLDCRADEEPIKEFMKRFTDVLFTRPDAIDLDLKSQFGDLSRVDMGRQWFARFLLELRTKSSRVDELTFHSLVQYFAIVLFECGEYEDFTAAAVIMNLCFLLYYEIEVPGCEPYREYIFTYIRQQPIWQMPRFWHAAFVDAVQSDREQRLAARVKRAETSQKKQKQQLGQGLGHANMDALSKTEAPGCISELQHKLKSSIGERPATVSASVPVEIDISSSSSSHRNSAKLNSLRSPKLDADIKPKAEMQARENYIYRQLGIFTCNMHSLGVPRSLCLEFLMKQSVSLNLSKDKIKPIRDNVQRMYHETDTWGAKEF